MVFTKFSKIFFLVLLLTAGTLFAQNKGFVAGKITDGSDNEALIGVNVIVTNTKYGASTDLDGYYKIALDPGTYQLKVSYISYQTVTIDNIIVENGKEVKVDVSLFPVTTELHEVVITAEALKNSETSVLKIQKNSSNIVDGISSELITKNNNSDGADILKSMTGVTMSEGKFAYIRGVGDRYNNTMLNGANLPSTDPEKKSFSYDLFPASLIEQVITSKTFSPDQPADFAGGLVQINTIEFPEKFMLNLGYSSSYNTVTSTLPFRTYTGGSSDWLGYDDGTRSLPSNIGDTKVTRGNFSNDQLQAIGKSFSNDWGTTSVKAPFNSNYKLNIGDRYEFGENILGYIGSITYSSTTDKKEFTKAFFTSGDGARYSYEGINFVNSVSWGAMFNVSFKFLQNHKISLKNTFNQYADDETVNYEGQYSYASQIRKTTSLRYVSRSLRSHQLIGEHFFDFMSGLNFDWNINISNSNRNEPDQRKYIYWKSMDEPSDPYRFMLGNGSEAVRYFGNLNDDLFGSSFNILLKPFEDASLPSFKTGFKYDTKKREFDARLFGFANRGTFTATDSILQQSVDKIFVAENFNSRFIEVSEITKPSDSYNSDQDVTAGYFMTDATLFERLKIVAGFRYEYSRQTMLSKTETNQPVDIVKEYNDVLPALNLTYTLTPSINLRAAYGQTLARPEFREMAPFSYFDFLSNELVLGNPKLTRSIIHNYDLRAEWFPTGAELIAVSLFYKNFVNPLEQVLISSSGNEPTRSYANALSATNYGVELELRKSLSLFSDLLSNFFFVSNLSFINSEIKLSDNNGYQTSSRPLQGQANYIINCGLYYDDYVNGLNAAITFNRVGEKVLKAGSVDLGDIVEKPRDQIDLSVSKVLFSSWTIKFAVKDILAQDEVYVQEVPVIGDRINERILRGRNFSLGISYKL